MTVINPYLNFAGNCEEAFTYYREVFGGEFSYLGRFGEMPPQEGVSVSEEDANKIMHMSLPISKETILTGSDSGAERAPKLMVGNNITLSITAENREDADRFFAMLSDGGKVTMPMDQTFWGDYFGMCTDRFGINWMISLAETSDNPL